MLRRLALASLWAAPALAQPIELGPEIPAGEAVPGESAPAEPLGAEPVAGPAPAAPVAAPGRPASLAQDAEARLALEAYNDGRYEEAAQRFLQLVQRWPREPAPYRALARARVWTGDAGGAVVAYRTYLAVSPDASDRDKIEAELKLARRKLGGNPPAGPPPEAVAALAEAEPRARDGRFLGPDGAFAALDAAEDQGYLGPGLADARDKVTEALTEASDGALDRWWRPDVRLEAGELGALMQAWDELKLRRTLTVGEAPLPGALAGLQALAEDRGDDAIRLLGPVAPGDPRLRYAQAIALLQAGRAEEAEALLALLTRTETDARVPLLLGLTRRLLGRDDAVDALRAALLDE
ncbi:MAG: tetratricopeptide repeat protein [Myxococcales bacterium]|nr:tetratricopeptide repeat protein [Myxococcales bacterium]